MIKNQNTEPGLHHAPNQWPKQYPWLVNLNVYENNRIERLGNVYIWLAENIKEPDWYSYATGKAWKFRTKEDAMLFYMTWL